MRRIGTTEQGKLLLEATPEELLTIDQAITTLMEWRAMCAVQALAPQSPPPPAVSPQRAAAEKVCKRCGKRVDVKKGLVCRACLRAQANAKYAATAANKVSTAKRDKNCATCKAAFRDESKTNVRKYCATCLEAMAQPTRKLGGPDRAFAPRPLVTNEKAKAKRMERRQAETPRERDERLDRPISNGRVLSVGAQD
jgi:hypothetical protein